MYHTISSFFFCFRACVLEEKGVKVEIREGKQVKFSCNAVDLNSNKFFKVILSF